MNGIRLPDPMNQGYEPYLDIEPRMIPSTNRSRPANPEDSRDNTPRNKSHYDYREDSVSSIRLTNHVNQAHALGSNVYSSKDVTTGTTGTTGTTRQTGPNVNISNVTRVTDSLYDHDFEGRSVNYESIQTDLNSTILSNYTEGISSVDSFEYKYYRSNDPDEFEEANRSGKYRRQSTIQPRSQSVKQSPARPSRPSKESSSHQNSKSGNEIVESPSRKPASQVDISSGGPNDDTRFYQLTKDELCKGLGSIGLALSKVFSLTGKGVLYLCSSITDSTEGLFETEKNTTDKVAELHSRGDTNYRQCNCSTNSIQDHRATPDLRINYEPSCQLNGVSHKYTHGRHNAVFYDEPEPSGKHIDNRTYMDDIHLLERPRGQMAPSKQEMCHRNVNNKPSDYDKNHPSHSGYLNKVNSHYDNFKIEFGQDLDYSNGNNIPVNGYERNYPYETQMNRNLYRDRELRRGDRMVERAANNRFVSSYSIDEPINRPIHSVRSPEPATVISNLGNNDIRTIQSNGGVQKPTVNTISRRLVEFNKENVNSQGFDKLKTVELAERTKKNTLEGTNFGRPCVSAYGADTNETENKPGEKPNLRTSDGERTSSYKPPEAPETKYLRTEIREQMSLKENLMKELKDQNTDEIDDNTSRSFFRMSNNDCTSQSNYSRTKSVDGISIGDGSSNNSLDKISISEYDTDKSVDSISMGQDVSKDGRKKKGKKGMFSFGKKSK